MARTEASFGMNPPAKIMASMHPACGRGGYP